MAPFPLAPSSHFLSVRCLLFSSSPCGGAGVMASWETVSTTITSTDSSDETWTTTALSLIPPDTSTPATTRYIDGTETFEVYTTWNDNAATPVTTQLSSESTADEPTSIQTASPSVKSDGTTNTATAGNTQPDSNGVSSGTLAGVIAGSIVGTALVALLFAFLFFRRRQAKPSKQLETESRPDAARLVVPFMRHKNSKSGGDIAVASITPPPADDDTVRKRILALIGQVSLHIDNYYISGSSPAHIFREQTALLSQYNSEDLPATVATLLAQRGLQRQIITHVLVRTLLRSIHPGGTAELLPRVFAAQPVFEERTPDTEATIFNWRMLTAQIYAKTTQANSNDPGHTADRNQAAEVLATQFTTAFAPYSFPSFTVEERVEHLRGLAISAADLGVWLFSQPCAFEFLWETGRSSGIGAGTGSSGEFSVVPKLVKVGDEKGVRLATPQVLVEGEKQVFSSKVYELNT